MEKALLEAWWAQLGIGGMGFATLIYFLLKSGKLSVSLIAPTSEKKVEDALTLGMKDNVGLMERNLNAFGTTNRNLEETNRLLHSIDGHLVELVGIQREVKSDIRVQNEVVKLLRRE
jgi:hypothetical protein